MFEFRVYSAMSFTVLSTRLSSLLSSLSARESDNALFLSLVTARLEAERLLAKTLEDVGTRGGWASNLESNLNGNLNNNLNSNLSSNLKNNQGTKLSHVSSIGKPNAMIVEKSIGNDIKTMGMNMVNIKMEDFVGKTPERKNGNSNYLSNEAIGTMSNEALNREIALPSDSLTVLNTVDPLGNGGIGTQMDSKNENEVDASLKQASIMSLVTDKINPELVIDNFTVPNVLESSMNDEMVIARKSSVEEPNLAIETSQLGGSTLLEALETYQSLALNHRSVIRIFLESMTANVVIPMTQMATEYRNVNAVLMPQVKTLARGVGNALAAASKSKAKLDSLRKIVKEKRERLISAKFESEKSSLPNSEQASATNYNFFQWNSLLKKLKVEVDEAMSDEIEWNDRHEKDRLVMEKAVRTFHMNIHPILAALQKNEEKRIETIKACLQRQLVEEVSYVSNRNYDMNDIHLSYEAINSTSDIHAFVEATLSLPEELPELSQSDVALIAAPFSPSFKSTRSAPVSSRLMMSPASPYVSKKHRMYGAPSSMKSKRDDSDMIADIAAWIDPLPIPQKPRTPAKPAIPLEEELEDLEELYLGDLIDRLSVEHDLSSSEMKKLNSTLQALKQHAPFALMRVLFHYANPENLLFMADHAFDFFVQLVRNMIRKFLQLKDNLAACATTFLARYIFRSDSEVSILLTLKELNATELDSILHFEQHFFDPCFENATTFRFEDILTLHLSVLMDKYSFGIRSAIFILQYLSSSSGVFDADRFETWKGNVLATQK